MSDQTETPLGEPPSPFSFGFASGISSRTGEPFVHIQWGDRAATVPPFVARQLGAQAFDVANAAETDASVFHMVTTEMGLDEQHAAAFVSQLREHRLAMDSRPDAIFAFRETDTVDGGGSGRLPDKVEGEHRFMVAASYAISADALGAAFEGEEMHLDHESRFALVMGCFDCEQEYGDCKDTPCPGDPAEQ